MTAYLIDSIFGYITWAILILLVWSMIKLLNKEKIKTINFRVVLLVSLIGVISPSFNLLSGKYQTTEISEPDKVAFKQILQSSFSGELISADTHRKFYTLVDKYKMSQSDIDELFYLYFTEELVLLQKSFYKDALKTIQTGQISESKTRLELEEKLLTDFQKKRNIEYLRMILSYEPIDINGEKVVLDEELLISIIENINFIFKVGTENANALKNRDAFN